MGKDHPDNNGRVIKVMGSQLRLGGGSGVGVGVPNYDGKSIGESKYPLNLLLLIYHLKYNNKFIFQ